MTNCRALLVLVVFFRWWFLSHADMISSVTGRFCFLIVRLFCRSVFCMKARWASKDRSSPCQKISAWHLACMWIKKRMRISLLEKLTRSCFFLFFSTIGWLVIPIVPTAEPPRIPEAPARLTVTWQTENSALASWLPPLSADVPIDEYKVLFPLTKLIS